jgi:uncharacterized protein (TIRG00374 family)
MSLGIKKALSYFIPLVLGGGLLYFVFNEIDLKQTWEDFKGANYLLVFVAGVLAVLSHVVRAARWNVMLKPMGFSPSLYNSSLAVLIGYITNLIFPRAGEVARSVSLQKSENVAFDKSFGAVIAERLVDVLVLLVLMVVNLFFEYDRIVQLFQDLFPDFSVGWVLPAVAVLGLVGVFVFFKFKDKIFELPVLSKFKSFIDGLKEGFVSVLNLEKPWLFVTQSFVIWVLYYISSMLLCYSIDIGSSLSPVAILTVLVMGTIGMAVPTMGGIGSYHLLVGKIVTLYGLSNQDGISLATFLHTMNGIVFVLVFGSVALVLSTLTRSKDVK